jgi:hypothetical protein
MAIVPCVVRGNKPRRLITLLLLLLLKNRNRTPNADCGSDLDLPRIPDCEPQRFRAKDLDEDESPELEKPLELGEALCLWMSMRDYRLRVAD